MRPKLCQRNLIATCLIILFSLSAGMSLGSCQRRDYPTASQQQRINNRLPYLDFAIGYTGGGGMMSAQEGEVVLDAMARAKISKVDGMWQMIITSSKEGNMSPQVFELLQQAVNNSNAQIRKYKGTGPSRPIDPSKIIIR